MRTKIEYSCEILTKTALENLKYMNIYNSLLRKKLCLPPSDPKMHCQPRGKLEMSTYPSKHGHILSVIDKYRVGIYRKHIPIVSRSPHIMSILIQVNYSVGLIIDTQHSFIVFVLLTQ